MSRELSDLYRSLAEDADGRSLAGPGGLRRRADRRARRRITGAALGTALLVGGLATGTGLVLAEERGPVAPPAAVPPQATVPASPAASAPPNATTPSSGPPRATGTPAATAGGTGAAPPRAPRSVPDRAFFVQAAGNRTGMEPAFRDTDALPALCDARYRSDAGIVQRRTRNLAYKLPPTPPGYVPDGSYAHTITLYRPGRADEFLRELRAAVRDCPAQPGVGGGNASTSRLRLLADDGFGDGSVLFEIRTPARDVDGNPTGGDEVRLVRAIRVGDVVTVLWEQGWEGTSSTRAQVDIDSRRAVDAIEDWLR
ncbi:hypothetical protein [Micromonospora peucetia]|uniref:Uncharacterized protein n=1 Tax=Micromonospora peucetia TaxID=47871 RepID=A0A1C6VE98_9ACTN|nr:hypothetical protein [Micromonospora peucetia]WSA30130.1 hypothetical protein OIE14_18100 [Micromonospora peucetia]SCL64354.1 hypothetical protein GA0070608_2939 [Micromonospora peucetia]